MDSVVEKLADIEATAEAITQHAQAQKTEIEKEIQKKRNHFDRELEDKTQNKLAKIRKEGEDKMNLILEEQRLKNNSTIQNLEKDFKENHALYAEEILNHIIEV